MFFVIHSQRINNQMKELAEIHDTDFDLKKNKAPLKFIVYIFVFY